MKSSQVLNDATQLEIGRRQMIAIKAVGITTYFDSNPVARYNFVIKQYNNPQNQIKGIELTQCYSNKVFSVLYDTIIACFQCKEMACEGWHCLGTFIFFILFVASFVIFPVCIVQFVISSLFILYYICLLIVFCINSCRLGDHYLTQRMLHWSQSPQFNKTNEYFKAIHLVEYYMSINKPHLAAKYRDRQLKTVQFMAYTQNFLDHYTSLFSFKMIFCHFLIIGLPTISLVVTLIHQ